MPEILARFDRNVYAKGSPLADVFIGVTSMQTFESMNKPVKKSVSRAFRGKFCWRSILQHSIAFHQPDLFLPPKSTKIRLRNICNPERLIRPAANGAIPEIPQTKR